MCYVHLVDNCPTCNSYKQRYGHEPDHVQWTDNFIRGNDRETPFDSKGNYIHPRSTSNGAKEIRIFGIKVEEIG